MSAAAQVHVEDLPLAPDIPARRAMVERLKGDPSWRDDKIGRGLALGIMRGWLVFREDGLMQATQEGVSERRQRAG